MMPASRHHSEWYRTVEKGIIVAFIVILIPIFAFNPATSGSTQVIKIESETVTAMASAMPNQGWAPMTVFFSAYGSESKGGRIVKYEWDLDGNGIYDTDSVLENGYVSYQYLKPGEYTISLRVTDENGNQSTDSEILNIRHPAASSVDYWTVFDDTQVRKVVISISQENWTKMWNAYDQKLEVRADANVFGEQLNDIGFRMRGQFSLRESRDKKPWKINTDAYIEGQEYHNLRQLMFINNIGDPSMLKEKLAYEMMRFAGVPASHVGFAELWFDFVDDSSPPVFWGVYTLVERVDQKFISNRFGRDSKGGNLYKASHAQRGPMDLAYYGPDIEDYPKTNGNIAYGKANNESENDYSDVIRLCYVIDGVQYSSPEEFAQALEAMFDVDTFIRYMAVVNVLGNWDSYPVTGNNYYLFNDPQTGKFEWIPWDLTWGDNPNNATFGVEGMPFETNAPLYDNVFEVERYQKKYHAYMDLLVRYWFTTENVQYEATQYHELIKPYVYQDTGDRMFFGNNVMFSPEAFENSVQELVDFVSKRSVFIQSTYLEQ